MARQDSVEQAGAVADTLGTVVSLRPASKGYNLVVKVLDAKTVVNKPRGGIAECLVGDATGTVVFSARNEQVLLAKPGSYLALKNARVDMYRGSMRVVVDRWGKVEALDGHAFEPRTDFNMSLIEFELVAFDGSA